MSRIYLKRISVFMAAVCFMLCACEKKEDAEDKASVNISGFEEDTMSGGNTEDFASEVKGVIYVNRSGLYTETGEGKMKWAAEASLGDMPFYLGEKKEAERTDGQKRVFFRVELNGKEYWVQDYSYEPNTVPAFISVKDTLLYKSESLAAVTDEIIPQYLIVAVYRDSLEDSNGKFVKIAAYSPEFISSWSVKEKYVKREAVEMGEVNVAAMILVQAAMESKNDTIRAELFQNAIETDCSYTDDILVLRELAEVIIKEENFMNTLSPEKINEKVSYREDINLLSIPSTDNGRILYTLKAGSVSIATRKVVVRNAEAETEEEWFYIQDKQKKGWVQLASIELKSK